MKRSEEALLRFEKATSLPMLALALLFIVIIGVPEVVDLSPTTLITLETVELLLYAVFVVEIGIRLYLAPNRLRYAVSHWFDILIILVPFLRPLRAVLPRYGTCSNGED